MFDSSMFSLLLSTCFFCAEQVEGVILSHFYCLGFIIRDLLHAWKLGVVVVAHKILETSQSTDSSSHFYLTVGLDLGLGLGLSINKF